MTPNTTHCNPEQRPNRQELTVGITKSTAELKDADQNQVADQGPFSTVSIGQETEDERAERSEEESEGDGGGDVFSIDLELCGESGDS